MTPALSATATERNVTVSSRIDRITTPPMNSGRRSRGHVALVDERRRRAADADRHPGAGQHVRAQLADQVRGSRSTAARSWGRRVSTAVVARGVERRLADRRDARLLAQLRSRARSRNRGRPRPRTSAASSSGPLAPAPKPLLDEVVGLARRRRRAVVAGVGEAQPQAEERRGEHEQHRGGGERGRPRPPLHGAAPARGRRVVGIARRAVRRRGSAATRSGARRSRAARAAASPTPPSSRAPRSSPTARRPAGSSAPSGTARAAR